MKEFRWVLIWSLWFSFLMAEEYRTIIRPSGVDTQNFKRVALVIGNDSYEVAPLSNAVDDADAMKIFLEAEKFKVIYANNADEQTMKSKVTEFLALLNSKSIGFVYYSGHGIQEYSQNERRTVNYLIPTNNAQFRSLTDLDYHALSLNYVLDSLSEKKNGLNIVLLDACRTPFKAFSKSLQVGLAPSNAQGVYIAYATASGDKALDNSLFRKSFIKYAKESLRLVDIFEKVKMDVYGQTQQVPFISNGKIGSFYFREKQVIVPPTPTPMIVKPYQNKIVNTASSSTYLDEKSSCEKVNLMNINVTESIHISSVSGNLPSMKNNLDNYIIECSNGQSSYCNRLGYEYSKGKTLNLNYKKSVEFYNQGCSLGNEWSCISLANAYVWGKGTLRNKDKAINLYKKMCKSNNHQACHNLGNLLFGKEKVALYQKGCDLGDRFSCGSLAMFYKGGTNGIQKNCSKILSLLEKSCELGNKRICKKLEKIKLSNW